MEDFVGGLTRGNPTEVKVVLATVAMALAVYQLALIAVGYGKVRPPFLGAEPASKTHRASGDTILVLLLVVSFICLAYFGWEDFHAVTGATLMVVLAAKVGVLRFWPGGGRYLPALGISVFVLLGLTWATSAGSFL